MPLQAIRATFECDGCGRPFVLDMDAARKLPADWSLFDDVVDNIRGGIGYRGFADEKRSGRAQDTGLTSVQAGMCLCPICTRKADDAVPDEEDRNATDEEVRAALAR